MENNAIIIPEVRDTHYDLNANTYDVVFEDDSRLSGKFTLEFIRDIDSVAIRVFPVCLQKDIDSRGLKKVAKAHDKVTRVITNGIMRKMCGIYGLLKVIDKTDK